VSLATLTDFTPTDKDWPRFMRVHPILDWSYADIWTFLRHPSLTLGGAAGGTIEWCEMYNYGSVLLRSFAVSSMGSEFSIDRYTSLGSTHNTFPNPLLKATDDPTIFGGWRPAWELKDETTERAGR
jgi:FAD synthetase